MSVIPSPAVPEIVGIPPTTLHFWIASGVILPVEASRRTGRGKLKLLPTVEIEIARILAEVYKLRPHVSVLRDLADFLRNRFTYGERHGITDWRAETTRRAEIQDRWTKDVENDHIPIQPLPIPPFPANDLDVRMMETWFDICRCRDGEKAMALVLALDDEGGWQAGLRKLENGHVDVAAPLTNEPVPMLLVLHLKELLESIWTHPAMAPATQASRPTGEKVHP